MPPNAPANMSDDVDERHEKNGKHGTFNYHEISRNPDKSGRDMSHNFFLLQIIIST